MNDDLGWVLAIIAWFVSAVVGAIIGLQKAKPAKGALLGFFLGPIGWILAAVDAGVGAIFALAAVAAGILIAAVISSEADKDRMAIIEREERAALARIKQERISGQTLYEAASSTASAPVQEEPSVASASPLPSPIANSIFPAGVDTPEERREYLQELAKQKQAGRAQSLRVRDRGY